MDPAAGAQDLRHVPRLGEFLHGNEQEGFWPEAVDGLGYLLDDVFVHPLIEAVYRPDQQGAGAALIGGDQADAASDPVRRLGAICDMPAAR